ncbi:MAG TPA: outer membrane protein assembly factor BamD [Phycisphaerae bacterium]|nr:outer membrane protein assembly factor BamD [Phycisphaerae bacterium]HDZ43105.1 outer membrane protein assembly factor BamD [Phycisphaerae bacterium]
MNLTVAKYILWMALVVLAGLALACDREPGAGKPSLEIRGGKWLMLDPSAPETPAGSLARIRDASQGTRYGRVVRWSKRHVKRFGSDPTTEEALLLAGQAELARGRYYQAFERFDDQLSRYPAGEFSAQALLGEVTAGEALISGKKRVVFGIFRIGATDEGVMILEKVAGHAPGTQLAEDVLLRIGDWYYAHAQWAKAIESYDQFMKLFPRSRRTPDAMLNAARASVASFHGIDYDETPLLEAQQRYEQFVEQFPVQAEAEGVVEALADIRDQRAGKLYECARFYERTNRLQTAIYYYRKLTEQFPDTSYALLGEDALMQMGLLDLPSQEVLERAERQRQRLADRRRTGDGP